MAAPGASAAAEPKKLWGGRFTGATDPLMEKFNESLPFDKRMWSEDIRVGKPPTHPWHRTLKPIPGRLVADVQKSHGK